MKRRDSLSIPFVAFTMQASECRYGAAPRATSRIAWLGTAKTTIAASLSDSSRSELQDRLVGRRTPDRYRAFSLVVLTALHRSRLRDHRTTGSAWLSASVFASAVPQAPAPRTATLGDIRLSVPSPEPPSYATSGMIAVDDPRAHFLRRPRARRFRRCSGRHVVLAQQRLQVGRADQRPLEPHASPKHHELRSRSILPADGRPQRTAQADSGRIRDRSLLHAALHSAGARQRGPLGSPGRHRVRVHQPGEKGRVRLRRNHSIQSGLQVRRGQLDLRVLRHAFGRSIGLRPSIHPAARRQLGARVGSSPLPTTSASRWCRANSRRALP